MNTQLLKVALRQSAICLPGEGVGDSTINETTSVLLANCAKLGFTFSEPLLHRINTLPPTAKLEIFDLLKEVTGATLNWTPLAKQWDIPTGESVADHVITFFANIFTTKNGTRLACGHLIPDNTFPIERYNGCPFCGTPFEFEQLELSGTPSKLKVLELWTEADLQNCMKNLLQSPVALDASQVESLKALLAEFGLDTGVQIAMKETTMLVIAALVELGKDDEAGQLFASANDVLRYLWYEHTGFLQIITPKTLIRRTAKNAGHLRPGLDGQHRAKIDAVAALKLKYTRTECKRYAKWLNAVSADAGRQCELMHPKRGMWVRVIRALRLAEYSKAKGMENLAHLLDVFYNEAYEVWGGELNTAKLKMDADKAFRLLKQRPGLFARSLFSAMLWFGPETTIGHFHEIMDQVPKRLIFTLNMYAEVYFDKTASRTVKPLGGVHKRIQTNRLLTLFSDRELANIRAMIEALSLEAITKGLMQTPNTNKTIFIDPQLFNIPIAIGDRSENVQDLPNALTGTRFTVEGSKVRLFMQWGAGLPAQHLDMDLSCSVAYEDRNDFCSFSQLAVTGCKHSGDIRSIPAQVGTAEYIEIDLGELSKAGAKYVTFTCNAYSHGALTPNMVVGWMHSVYPMKITSNGVAYDPANVQHQVRITQPLAKGLVFGVLDVARREIVWLEMAFGGQLVQNMSPKAVEALLVKLDSKLKIGELLQLKAGVQQLAIVEDAALADESYDLKWAMDTAAVSKLFLD